LTKAVSVDAIYDAFNHGIRDARAIKAFLGYSYRQWQTGPRYVALAGDGAMDYRKYTGADGSLIPSIPSDGLHGVYASDHVMGDITGDGNLDVVIGRIPVKNASQLGDYVNKLKAFEQGGAWRGNVLISTDNNDIGGSYHGDGDLLAAKMAGRNINRADIDVLGVAGASEALKQGLNEGSEVMVYVGHGNFQRLAEEGILTTTNVPELTNEDKPGVVSAFGCLMGSVGLPGNPSIGEKLITSQKGASAMIGSSSLVNNQDGVTLGLALFDGIYQQGMSRLGDAWVNAKNSQPDGGSSKIIGSTYQLLGDPSLSLGDADAPRGGPAAGPSRPSYQEWLTWAFAPAWLDQGLSTDPNADPDGDLMTNWEEYIAGTDPLDTDSEFVVVKVQHLAPGQTELTWPSVPGRLYRIERADSASGTYSVISNGVEATAPENKWVDSQAGSVSFYRVSVE